MNKLEYFFLLLDTTYRHLFQKWASLKNSAIKAGSCEWVEILQTCNCANGMQLKIIVKTQQQTTHNYPTEKKDLVFYLRHLLEKACISLKIGLIFIFRWMIFWRGGGGGQRATGAVFWQDRLRSVSSQWMIAQMVERLLCTWRTQVQIPAPAPYEITL